jgi:SGNH domain-containing protein
MSDVMPWMRRKANSATALISPRRVLPVVAILATVLAGTTILGGPPAGASGSVATNAQVLAAVKAAQSITRVPSNLEPALTNENDIEVLNTGVCPAHYSAPKVGLDPLHFGDCVYGDPSGKRLLDIFGDSHAGMWLTAIRYAAARTGWKVRIFYFPGCPAPDITFYSAQTNSPNTGCNTFRTDAIAAIRKTHPGMVVVTSASFEQQVSKGVAATSAQWETGLSKTLSMLKMPGTQLAVMGDIPILTQDDPTCLAAHETNVKACATPLATAETGVYVSAEQQAASANGALYVPTEQWICAQLCVPIVGRIRVYNDQYHISATYAKYLSGAVQSALHLG